MCHVSYLKTYRLKEARFAGLFPTVADILQLEALYGEKPTHMDIRGYNVRNSISHTSQVVTDITSQPIDQSSADTGGYEITTLKMEGRKAILVNVLGINLKGRTDLWGKSYQPTKHIYTND